MRKALTLITAAAAIVVMSAALAATASAGVSPPGAKTGTTGAVTFAAVNCTAGSFTGTWGVATTGVSTDMQLAFSGCRKSNAAVTIACTNTGVLTVTGVTSAGITPLSLASLSCTLSLNAAPTCHATVSGSVVGTFNNTNSSLSISASGQSLTVTGSTCTSTFPNGTTSMSAATYVVSPATTLTF